ncbi:hypothetical protein [Salinimicrobium sediminilitoris]|uniref:hypothetical protein n=1 Tax=Salinimicrobium sediminilitoris TaxID=2876715 RepID=UPI001E659033|nr:hypothetical protein [Salinimicrobium sediminilitoris]MCC8358923.1 hypothetical protein [Salinimicrobium sediminilitoris]
MKKTLFTFIVFVPIIAFGQDKTYSKKDLQTETVIANYTLLKPSNESERNIETVLIDDRNFSKSLIDFNLDKSYSLSFTEKSARLSKFIDDKDSNEEILELEPFLYFEWKLRKSN